MCVNSNETMGGLLTRGSVVVCGESRMRVCVYVCVTDARCQVKCGKDRKQENLEKEGKRKRKKT